MASIDALGEGLSLTRSGEDFPAVAVSASDTETAVVATTRFCFRRQKARIKHELGGLKIPFGDHIGATRLRAGEPNRGNQEHQRLLNHDVSPFYEGVVCIVLFLVG